MHPGVCALRVPPPTRRTPAGTCLHKWSWAGWGTRPAQRHSGWSSCGARSTACGTLRGTPSSRRTSFGIPAASEPGLSPWASAGPYTASEHLGPRLCRPQKDSLPDSAPSWYLTPTADPVITGSCFKPHRKHNILVYVKLIIVQNQR